MLKGRASTRLSGVGLGPTRSSFACYRKAGGAPSRGSGNGIYGTVLEAGMGSAGTILATDLSETRRRGSNIGNLASGAGAIESWPARSEERLWRRRAAGEAAGSR